ncbi:NAD-dependent protein deacetylase Sirt2 [Teleopsis dalmanni]|uniref:NAD-dependent protein deacetylase Sirt2 n=1 Tax=Teleopsis dalmanni TaxID=139649 RepID=UPI0018CE3937|nr:NAD-dependent protein deacetylase Sirt2 [Teleopsis dalmanni]
MSDDEAPSGSDRKNKPKKEDKADKIMDSMSKFFSALHLFSTGDDSVDESSGVNKVIHELSFDGLIKHWKHKGFKNIVTMVGAGISTSAGIPDFRSPGSGLYDNLKKYNLPYPTAIFELDYFNENPQPFFALAKELYPGTFNPTPSHYFVRLLHEKGLLLRHYTQNIDTLERIAGIPGEKLVEAHGTFHTNHCLECSKLYTMEWMKDQIFADNVPTCSVCNGVVKPDIVFFGENLPADFYALPEKDFKKCDLLIIMGTSLEVQPFAMLVDHAKSDCVRLLINRTKVGQNNDRLSWFSGGPSLNFDSKKNTRDIAYIGDCDDGAFALADGLGWGKELRKLIQTEHQRLKNEAKTEKENIDKIKKIEDTDISAESTEEPCTSKQASSRVKNKKITVTEDVDKNEESEDIDKISKSTNDSSPSRKQVSPSVKNKKKTVVDEAKL